MEQQEGIDRQLLTLEYMPLSELLKKRDAQNPKDHDFGELDGSMERWGYTAPVSINEKTGNLVAGHGRLENLEMRRADGRDAPERIDVRDDDWYVPVIRGLAFATDAEARGYMVADNRLTELGGWDEPALVETLKSIAEESDNLYGVGFDEDDLDQMIADMDFDEEIGALSGTEERQWDPEERFEKQYMSTDLRQIIVVMHQTEYVWALDILKDMHNIEDDVETNTEAILLLLTRWREEHPDAEAAPTPADHDRAESREEDEAQAGTG